MSVYHFILKSFLKKINGNHTFCSALLCSRTVMLDTEPPWMHFCFLLLPWQ